MQETVNLPSAIGSTRLVAVPPPIVSVGTNTPAASVTSPDIPKRTATQKGSIELYGLKPRYLRHNLWTNDLTSFSPTTAEWFETALPLPSPPLHELQNPIVQDTLHKYPHLFKISTPIKVDVFEGLLQSHPNRPFVKSVCQGLRDGFWPWADTHQGVYPNTHKEDRGTAQDPEKANFLRATRDAEIAKGRWSAAFGADLLPGMYSSPIHAVPKPHSTDLRLVTDLSAGSFSVNSMMDHEKVKGFPLDNLKHIGEVLLALWKAYPNRETLMWKSDITEAYRLLCMHPTWQPKQVIFVDGEAHVDHANTFGSCASAAIFISFNSLVAWIAKNVEGISGCATYVDDTSGVEFTDNVTFYEVYQKKMPSKQVTLLRLWDKLGIPHKEKKQVSGSPLTVIGIDIDSNAMTLTLPNEGRKLLIDELRRWAVKPRSKNEASFRLKQWQALTGWVNWSFNVYPNLRPCLNNIYAKLCGPRAPNQNAWVNNAIRSDLHWAADHLEKSTGVRLLRAKHWNVHEADIIIYCDACLEGMGYWFPDRNVGYYSPVPLNTPTRIIFYYEALCVAAALHHVQMTDFSGRRILIYTDNMNSVDIFNSFRAKPEYNYILRFAVDILIKNDYDLRVLHVPGESNGIADALSRCDFPRAISLSPTTPPLKIRDFQPPQLPLGAAKK